LSFNGDLNAGDAGEDLTTKGDLHGFDTENTRIPVGADGTVLTADSTAALGLAYSTSAANVLTTQGDVLYHNASGLARLAAGISGQQLQTQGAGANPHWVTAAGGSVAADELVNDYSTTLADYNEAMTTATASNNDSSSYELDQLNDGSTNSFDGVYGTHGYALKIEAGSSLVGVDVTSIKMKMMKQNNWDGVATVGVGSTCGSTSTHVFGTKAGSSLSTSSWTLSTFNTGSHTFAVDDYLAVTATSLNDYYELKVAGDSGSPIANTPMYANRQTGGCQTGGSTFYLEIEGTANHVPTNAIKRVS